MIDLPNLRGRFRPLLECLPAAAGRAANSPGAGAFVLLVFLLVSSAWVIYANSRDINLHHSDEYHTLMLGVRHFDPLGPANENFVVGETTRWFVRLLYPGGIYYLYKHLGNTAGNGGISADYLARHYVTDPGGATLREPAVQDFVFFMRVAFGLLAVGSFCLALWSLQRRVNPAAATAYGAAVLGNPLVFDQFRFFYSETSLFILFNLAAFICLSKDISYRRVAYSGILAAAALSAKLTGIFIVAAPLFMHAAVNMRTPAQPMKSRFAVFLLFFLGFLFLININAPSFRAFIHDTLWNVFHFNIGVDEYAGRDGPVFFPRLLMDAGCYALPLFLVALLWLARAPRMQLAPVYLLGAGIAFTAWSLASAATYLPRNAASLHVAMSFVIALAVGDLVGKTLGNRPALQGGASAGLLLLFLAGAAALMGRDKMPAPSHVFFNEIDIRDCRHCAVLGSWHRHWRKRNQSRERMRNCVSSAAIGLAEDDLRYLREKTTGDVTAFPGISGKFKFNTRPMPGRLRIFLADAKEPELLLADEYRKHRRHDCLFAYRQGETRQITNFLAPQHYALEDRVGNFFFFARKPDAKTDSAVKTSRGRVKLKPRSGN